MTLNRLALCCLNIAQANRLQAPPNCASALRHYELYLAAEPRAAERVEVESYIKTMRACVEQERQAMAPRPAASPVAATPRAATPRSRVPLWTAGAGALVLVGGAGLYTRARLRFNELKDECPCADSTIDDWQNGHERQLRDDGGRWDHRGSRFGCVVVACVV